MTSSFVFLQFSSGLGCFAGRVLGDGEPQSGTGDRKFRNLEDARPWTLKFAQESLGPFKSGCRFFFVNYNFWLVAGGTQGSPGRGIVSQLSTGKSRARYPDLDGSRDYQEESCLLGCVLMAEPAGPPYDSHQASRQQI